MSKKSSVTERLKAPVLPLNICFSDEVPVELLDF